MTLELGSIPLAWAAGALSILSPCVWPLVPAVMSSSASSGALGPWFLGLGLSTSFAVAGTGVTFLLVSFQLDPELIRLLAAGMLVAVAVLLLIRRAGDWLALRLSLLTSRFDLGGTPAATATGHFGVGALLGLVWLPCVGPTLGAAIALASLGQEMGTAFLVMFAFGVGTASVLLVAGVVSGQVLKRWRPGLLARAETGKKVLGWTLLSLAAMVLTGVDKTLETLALGILPDWAISL